MQCLQLKHVLEQQDTDLVRILKNDRNLLYYNLSLTETDIFDVIYRFYFTYKSDVDSFTHFLNLVSDFLTMARFVSNHLVHLLFLSPVLK